MNLSHNICSDKHEPLLHEDDGPAFEIFNQLGKSPIVLVCEHASNRVPSQLDELGLTREQLESHIAWDPGASTLAQKLSVGLDAQLVAARFSRLVYDCNRPPEAISAMPVETEVCKVPGNADISIADRLSRTCEIYVPFHAALAKVIAVKRAKGLTPVIVTIHSFTPVFNGKRRHVEIGYLHGDDKRLADAMQHFSTEKSKYNIRLNQPYGPDDGVLHSIEKQRDDGNIPYVMIEVRNDLLTTGARMDDIFSLLSTSISKAVSSLDSQQQSKQAGSAQ